MERIDDREGRGMGGKGESGEAERRGCHSWKTLAKHTGGIL